MSHADETRLETWRRRALTIPVVLLGGALYLAALPLILLAAALRDLRFGRRLPTLRLALFGALYVLCELGGLAFALGIWLVSGTWAGASRARFEARNLALQRRWAGVLFDGVCRLYGVTVAVEGSEAVLPTPFLLFVRHASLVDTLLPAVMVGGPFGIDLRYVLKRELLVDPCFDVVGLRTPNVFVRRGTSDAKREVGSIHRLAAACPPEQAVLIYPEGTRFTAQRRERALARIEEAGDMERLARMEGLRRVLPPRTAGPQALLEARPDLDVVFLAHEGLDGLAKLAHFLDGDLVGRRIRGRFWRVRAADIPKEREARIRWLDAEWAKLDSWLSGLGDAAVTEVLLASAAYTAVAMAFLWALSVALRDASIVDLYWGPGFAGIAAVAFLVAGGDHPRRTLLLVLAALWGLRLGAYLLWRNAGKGEDFRYQAMRRHHGERFVWVSLFTVFGLQGVLQWIVSLPLQLTQAAPGSAALGALDGLGVALFAVGFFFETLGDAQLARFKADPKNQGQVMDRGLWRYTRHPNYFGDFMVWWGFGVIALAGPWGMAGLVGPALMSFLLLRVSGVAMLERDIGERRPGYREYVERTNAFFPGPPTRA